MPKSHSRRLTLGEAAGPREHLPYNRSMTPGLAISEYRGPLAVTLGYFALYYGFVLHVLRTKRRVRSECEARGEPFDRYLSRDRRLLTADRCMLNMLEHMPAFLTLFWLATVFVGSDWVTLAGALYVMTRLVYPFLMGPEVPVRLPKRLLVATYTSYAILGYLASALLLGWLRS